ncbi:MAG: prepilin peptidase [Bilifractor sp.]
MELTLFLKIYGSIISFVFGAVFGSFINCLSWRMVHGESIVKGRSHCAVCGHVLSAADLVPIFSYIFLKGRCRYCHEKISPRYMIAELLLAGGFTGVFIRYGLTVQTLRYMVLSCILLGLSLTDLDTFEIPNRFILAGIILWAVTIPFMGDALGTGTAGQQLGGGLLGQSIIGQLIDGLLGGALIAGALLVLSLIFDKVTGKEGLGGGDIKLFFMTGLFTGPGVGLFNLILSCIAGLVFSAIRRQQKIPFGPAISIATYFSLLFGPAVVNWYLGLF